jgi:hypothetical protein
MNVHRQLAPTGFLCGTRACRKGRIAMRICKTLASTGTLALLFAGFLVSTPAKAADTPESAQVTKMLAEAKTMALQLRDDAASMQSFNFNPVTRQSHVTAINTIRDEINALGRHQERLQALESEAAPWQATAIERINPYLDEMAGYTMAVIEHLNGDAQHTFAEYRDYLDANADYSTDLAAMIGDFVKYGGSKRTVEQLGSKLEIVK